MLAAIDIAKLLSETARCLPEFVKSGHKRKNDSRAALEQVIVAARQTGAYCTHLKDGGAKELHTEMTLAGHWSSLAIRLENLNGNTLKGLAHRCDIKGRYWEDTKRYDLEFLSAARITLHDIEREAAILLKQI